MDCKSQQLMPLPCDPEPPGAPLSLGVLIHRMGRRVQGSGDGVCEGLQDGEMVNRPLPRGAQSGSRDGRQGDSGTAWAGVGEGVRRLISTELRAWGTPKGQTHHRLSLGPAVGQPTFHEQEEPPPPLFQLSPKSLQSFPARLGEERVKPTSWKPGERVSQQETPSEEGTEQRGRSLRPRQTPATFPSALGLPSPPAPAGDKEAVCKGTLCSRGRGPVGVPATWPGRGLQGRI